MGLQEPDASRGGCPDGRQRDLLLLPVPAATAVQPERLINKSLSCRRGVLRRCAVGDTTRDCVVALNRLHHGGWRSDVVESSPTLAQASTAPCCMLCQLHGDSPPGGGLRKSPFGALWLAWLL